LHDQNEICESSLKTCLFTNHEVICLWINVFTIVIEQWHSNVFSFKWLAIFLLYMCKILKKYSRMIFICFIWTIMKKKIYFEVWFVKQFGIIVIYSIVDNLCYNVKWLFVDKKMDYVIVDKGSNLGTNNCMLII
jgi:hypothetical protein